MRYGHTGDRAPGVSCLADIHSKSGTLARVAETAEELKVLDHVRSRTTHCLAMVDLDAQQLLWRLEVRLVGVMVAVGGWRHLDQLAPAAINRRTSSRLSESAIGQVPTRP